MTLLIISPDYLSHYSPLSVLGRAVSAVGERVVVATGEGLRPRVADDGFDWRPLVLGPASNAGIAGLDPAVQLFLDATTKGAIATIVHQAEKRERDLLWQPERVAADIHGLLDAIDPTVVLVDHVSFGSTLALYASGRPFVTLVPGHPTQLPVGEERYGIPPQWPEALRPDPAEVAALEVVVDRVTAAFNDRWHQALTAIDSQRPPVDDALRVHGDRVLYNSVGAIQRPIRQQQLPVDHAFVGPLVRQAEPGGLDRWLERADGRPQVYTAFGTFLSARGDVLARVADGLRQVDVRAAIAVGATPPDGLGPLPDDWLVAPALPQTALLAGADVAIHHGGNNSVQEALAAGCRQIVLPFSTDQFANAADLERRSDATVLDPNRASADDLAAAVCSALARPGPAPVAPTPASTLRQLLCR